jgi:tetratricopeptide (TPR) repeat protein
MGQVEVREAIETAFREHYDELGRTLYQLLESKEPKEQQIGQLLAELEYENLMTALKLALETQVSIFQLSSPLSRYLDAMQDHRRWLELGQAVMKGLEAYPSEKLTGRLGAEFVAELDDIAKRQYFLRRYEDAEVSCQKSLLLISQIENIDETLRSEMKASVYHNLGSVAKEQRQWEQAEQYYQQALQIDIDTNDRYSQARTFDGLGWVAQERREWEQAEQYYQQALQIYIEYSDRHSQAVTYHQLGRVAEEQRQWQQALEYFLRALEIDITYESNYDASIDLRSLARLWRASNDASLPSAVAKVLKTSVDETEKLLLQALGEQEEKKKKTAGRKKKK